MTRTSIFYRRQSGMTLIELMIGLAIGLATSLLILQTMTFWDSSKRTTLSNSEAQISGTIAMYQLDRDFKMAGMGFGMALAPFVGCQIATTDSSFSPRLAAVTIVQGASSAPDTLRLMYGNATYMTSGQAMDDATPTTKVARVRAGFNQGDRFVAAGTNGSGTVFCSLLEMTGIPAGADDGKTITHANSTTYTSFYDSTAHVVSPNNNTSSWTGSGFTGRLFNLGPSPILAEWQVSSTGFLQRSNRFALDPATGLLATPSPIDIAEGVVDLQAQYGVDLNGDNVIQDTEWTETDPTDWARVRAIRISLLIRGEKFDPAYTATNPQWCTSCNGGAVSYAMTNVGGGTDTNVTGAASNWRHYHYRVYENIIPMRNMIWGTSAPST